MNNATSACNGLKSVINRQGELETFSLSLKNRLTDLENNILAKTGKTTDKLQIVKTKDIIKINPLILRTGSSSDSVTYFVPLQPDLVAEMDDNFLLKFNILGTEIISSALSTVSHKRKIYYIEVANPDKLKRIDVDTGEVDAVMDIDPSQEYICHPIIYGKVLDDDIPVFACLGNGELYLLAEAGVETLQNESIVDAYGAVYCDKNKQLYIESVAYTNSSYKSITDTAKGVLLESSFQGDPFAVYSAPANNEDLLPYSEGKIVDLPEDSNYLPLTEYKSAYIFCMPNALYAVSADGTVQVAYTNLYQNGFIDGFDYFSVEHEDGIVVEISEDSITVASNIPVKVHGQVLHNGQMYDAIVKTYKEFVDFVVAKEAEISNNATLEDVVYKVLYRSSREEDILEELPTGLNGRYRLIGEISEGFKTITSGTSLYFTTPSAKILVDNVSYENLSMTFRPQTDSELVGTIKHLKNCSIWFSGDDRLSFTESYFFVRYCDSVEIRFFYPCKYKGSGSPNLLITDCNRLDLIIDFRRDDGTSVTYSGIQLYDSNLCTVDCNKSDVSACSQRGPGSNILVKNSKIEQIPITQY